MLETRILQQVQSSSNPDVVHEVRLGKDDKMYCTCPGWRHYRHCKHLDAYVEKMMQTAKFACECYRNGN